ncbi:hypothetical protein [Actinomadura formosensis]|uniref:hypothetical protein n=1 Tax=Actinomadura formosensis TaxID=60706 RepID=UPI003D8C144F
MHVKPNIGSLSLQAGRPGQITRLYRDLVTTGGRHGTSKSGRSRVVSLDAGTVDVLKAHRKR